MFTFDDKYIYTWELRSGRLIRPVRLQISRLTGQIINSPLRRFGFFNHCAIILGHDTCSFIKPVYVCCKTTCGYEICAWDRPAATSNLKFNPLISKTRCLERLKRFFESRQHDYDYPAYNITISNCQNFSHGIVYDGDIHVALTLAFLIFLVAYLVQ